MNDLPMHEVRRLDAAATGRSVSDVTMGGLSGHPDSQQLIERRRAGEPLQYLEGTVQFGPLELAVDRRALIPRPETEQLWEQAVISLAEAGPGTPIVDLGTGSGALALALKHSFPRAPVFGIDLDPAALTLAAENGGRSGLDVVWLQGDLFDPLPGSLRGRIELIVSNPPYVSDLEHDLLPRDVRDHEPRQALVAGPTGLEVLERIADDAFWWLGTGGWVLCEIGETQGEAALELFAMFDREVRRDLAGRDRFLVARKGASCCR